MSAPTTPSCPLRLTPDDLSAWRDHALSPADDQRISAHVRGCPVCQRILAAHETLARAIQAERPPAPDPRNWEHLRARIGASERGSRLRPARRPVVWGGLSAAAAVLLLSALFFHLFAQQAGHRGASSHLATPTAVATPQSLATVAPTTPISGPTLAWQSQTAPASVIPPPGNQFYTNSFAFAPTNARIAYICSTTNASNAPITIWATQNGAATWTHVSDVSSKGEVAQCAITIDDANPQHLNLIVSENRAHSYVSDDGGKTWRALSAGMQLVGLNTQGGVSVAVTTPWDFAISGNTPAAQRPSRLSVSRDDWRTWQPIDGVIVVRGLNVDNVWQRPGDGALLAEAVHLSGVTPITGTPVTGNTFPTITYTLWQSADLGAHWSQLPTPTNLEPTQGYLVAQPQGDEPWRICGFQNARFGSSQSPLIGCSQDGGHTWQSRPLPKLLVACGTGCVKVEPVNGADLLPNGSLIAYFFVGKVTNGVMLDAETPKVFRLEPGASVWQDLGSPPGSAVIHTGATLISYEGSGVLNSTNGEIVGQISGNVPNRGVIFLATLP